MEKNEFIIEEELKKLPGKPGVYLMHDETDQIIYVGKAISLKNRVRQYFQASRNKGAKIDRMVTHIHRFEYIVTDSELEALVLECNLIKEHHPKYNTMLMDDKSYPFIRVTTEEAYPRIMMSRTMKKDKSKYFGPYTSATAVKDTLDLIRKLYKIRSCNRNLPKEQGKERPCLNYHIHQCEAPCQGYISSEDYKKHIQEALSFLGGNYDSVIKSLTISMEACAENLEFEKAVEYRELLTSVKQIAQKQKITNSDGGDRDIIAMAMENQDAIVQIFFVRGGRLIGRDHFYVRVAQEDTQDTILTTFIQQFYAGTPYIPGELMLPLALSEKELLEKWLTSKRGFKVSLKNPQKGGKEKLVELAEQNAKIVLSSDRERIHREKKRTLGAVKEIEQLIGITGVQRIEAYDISNISGFSSVGSMVVYEGGKPKKNDYRKFRIKGVEGSDDYASMREVLTRRFQHGLQEQRDQQIITENEEKVLTKFKQFPDLIMMDGGKGQVNIALQVLDELKIQIPVCGMVKDDNHRTRGLFYENIEVPIDRHSEGFKLITRIQDEAHRFAIEYHRSLRSKGQVHSILDDIKGIGPTRRKALMRHFTSMEELKSATVEQLKCIDTMNEKSAQQVFDFFHK